MEKYVASHCPVTEDGIRKLISDLRCRIEIIGIHAVPDVVIGITVAQGAVRRDLRAQAGRVEQIERGNATVGAGVERMAPRVVEIETEPR